MWYQVQKLNESLVNITKQHPEGVHFLGTIPRDLWSFSVKNVLGYSQGALLGRTILQANPDHNVINYISLSGPQAGQYGSKGFVIDDVI